MTGVRSLPQRSSADNRHLMTASGLSILCHLLVIASRFSFEPPRPSEHRIEVRLLNPAPKQVRQQREVKPVQPAVPEPQKQYVSPSENSEAPKVPTRLLSEHDSRADLEKLKRGDPLSQPQQPQAQPKPEIKPQKESKQQPEKLARLEKQARPEPQTAGKRAVQPSLRLSDTDVLSSVLLPEQKKSVEESQRSDDKPSDSQRAQKFQLAQPFQRSLAASLRLGTSDHLPEIPDGDITLLNAKADRFAVFVRRVALQVFGALRRAGWQELHYNEVRKISGFSTVEAVMTPQGKLVKVVVSDSSGSTTFDALTQRAASEGAWDQNPPAAAAAEDHLIHFVFKARTWGRAGQAGVSEQRWLLLGTGLL